MKYTVEGFQQEKAVEYGLDVIDLAILRWFVDFQATNMMEIMTNDETGEVFHWINHSYLIEQMPILGLKTGHSVSIRMQSLVKKDVLRVKVKKTQTGSKAYYSTNTERFFTLLFSKPIGETGSHSHGNDSAHSHENVPNSSISNSSITNTETGKNGESIKTAVNLFVQLYSEKYKLQPILTRSEYAIIGKLLKLAKIEDVLEKIRLYFTTSYWFNEKEHTIPQFRRHYNSINIKTPPPHSAPTPPPRKENTGPVLPYLGGKEGYEDALTEDKWKEMLKEDENRRTVLGEDK